MKRFFKFIALVLLIGVVAFGTNHFTRQPSEATENRMAGFHRIEWLVRGELFSVQYVKDGARISGPTIHNEANHIGWTKDGEFATFFFWNHPITEDMTFRALLPNDTILFDIETGDVDEIVLTENALVFIMPRYNANLSIAVVPPSTLTFEFTPSGVGTNGWLLFKIDGVGRIQANVDSSSVRLIARGWAG